MDWKALLWGYRASTHSVLLMPGSFLEQMDVIQHHMGLPDLFQIDESPNTNPRHKAVLSLVFRDALKNVAEKLT